eukprot:1184120-Prorocentrum_minimum.AAC.3
MCDSPTHRALNECQEEQYYNSNLNLRGARSPPRGPPPASQSRPARLPAGPPPRPRRTADWPPAPPAPPAGRPHWRGPRLAPAATAPPPSGPRS